MSDPFVVDLDPYNPGEFYACCGLLQLCESAGAPTQSWFETNPSRPRQARFFVRNELALQPMQVLQQAQLRVLPAPCEASIRPVSASVAGREMILDWWLNEFHDQKSPFKCWAGQVTIQKLVAELPQMLPQNALPSLAADAFTSTRFGVDPRSAWAPVDLGYSPNEQKHEVRSYPAVELLAAFGLQGFRPHGSPKLGFVYSLWLVPLPTVAARSASTQPWHGLPSATYTFQLERRGSYKYFSFAKGADPARE